MDKIIKNIFLLDGIGAFVSASLLYFIVVKNPAFFGLEPKLGTILAIVPVFFCLYSLCCHFIVRPQKHFSKLLVFIALMNLAYCVYTFVMVFISTPEVGELNLSIYGKIYFIIELLIVLPLVFLELKIAKNYSGA